MTELQAGSFSRPRDPADVRHGTAGAATPGPSCASWTSDSGPRRSLFREYLKNPAETRKAFTTDGWFETGDTQNSAPPVICAHRAR